MKRAKMVKTAAGPDGTYLVGDFAPPERTEEFVDAKVAEWVDVPDDAPDYESSSFGGQSVAAFTEILTILGIDVPRNIDPRKVSAATGAVIDDLNDQVSELQSSLDALAEANRAVEEEAIRAAEEAALAEANRAAEEDAAAGGSETADVAPGESTDPPTAETADVAPKAASKPPTKRKSRSK